MFAERIEAHRRFWAGEGPSLILIPTGRMELYDTAGYRERFEDAERMWEAEMARAKPVLDWPTDGVPTVRPNLGVIFVPAIAGQDYEIRDGQMPWSGAPLERAALRACRAIDLAASAMMARAAKFYRVHRKRGGPAAAYLPDTQGVFDLAHLLSGARSFYDLADDPGWVRELLGISLDLYVRVSRHLKVLLGEPESEMVHGHGAEQGVYFPNGGVRISEDATTLLSPAMIDAFVLPFIERALAAFGGGFVHFCGRHRYFFESLCRMPLVRAIDLGNSEMYEPGWLLERCAETGTVLYSRLAAKPSEDWPAYIRRIAALVKNTGARLILRPLAFPESRRECEAMLGLWHQLAG